MDNTFSIFNKDVQDLIRNVIVSGMQKIRENENGWAECKFELTPYDSQFFIECTCDDSAYTYCADHDFVISMIYEENFTKILDELSKYNIINEFWHKNDYGDFGIHSFDDYYTSENILDEIFQKFRYYKKNDREKFFNETKCLFNEILGTYTLYLNSKKWNVLVDVILSEKPKYLLTLRNVNEILQRVLQANYSISEMEDILRVGDEYLFNEEYYIKGILCSTPENTAKLLDYFCKDPLIEKEKRENLKNLIEAFEENFAFVDSEKYKKNDKNFPHLYGNIAYNDKENRVIKGKVWEYNFKNSTLYIDTDTGRKIVNLADADKPRILVETILKSPNFYVHKSDFAFDAEKTLSNLKTNNMGKNGKVDKKYYGIFYMSKGNIGIRKDFEPKENPK